MEFEQDTTRSRETDDLTGHQHLYGETRSLTLEPLHDDISPDEMPDDYIANQHILRQPIANVGSDTEVTASLPSNPTHETRSITKYILASVIIVTIIVVSSYVYITTRL